MITVGKGCSFEIVLNVPVLVACCGAHKQLPYLFDARAECLCSVALGDDPAVERGTHKQEHPRGGSAPKSGCRGGCREGIG